jgi:FkbM family methyltransferase
LIKQSAYVLHKKLAGGPRSIAKIYILLMSAISRRLPLYLSARIHNSITQFTWPELIFKPKSVILGDSINVFVVPHLGEFDQSALFRKDLDYEAPVFAWLADYALNKYDKVIEIGANVGIYTVFLDALINRMRTSRLRKIVAFEPSQIPYRRLLANINANRSQHVDVFQAAVGIKSGFQSFFEPVGHLTNGSFLRDFAGIFADAVSETTVLVVGAQELEPYFIDTEKVLLKIDVEGFEPSLITALASLIRKYDPDLLIEVLDTTVKALKEVDILARYRKFLITTDGLRESPYLFASSDHRDWFLQV